VHNELKLILDLLHGGSDDDLESKHVAPKY